jgi:hypothetical protein
VQDQKPYIDANATKGNPASALSADATNNLLAEQHSRFLRAVYPSKLFVGYSQPGVDVTVGDFYVQLGRGLVFSVRKVDELSVDTTVRGVKAVADHTFGDVQVGAMIFGGQLNPLRVDEASGRRLNGAGSPLFFGFPTGGTLETYDITSQPGRVLDTLQPGRPSYLEDGTVGGRAEVGTKWFSLGANAAGLFRRSFTADYLACERMARGSDPAHPGTDSTTSGDVITQNICASQHPEFSSTDPSREHDRIVNWSGTLNVPSILKHGDLYVEVAGQGMRNGHTNGTTDLNGYAVYASASITGGPFSASLEG